MESRWSYACGIEKSGEIVCFGKFSCDCGASIPEGSGFKQVTVGSEHACAVHADGHGVCWGANLGGQCDVPDESFIQLAAGDRFTCGITSRHAVICWGDHAPAPEQIPTASFKKLAANYNYACGITEDQRLMCFGSVRW